MTIGTRRLNTYIHTYIHTYTIKEYIGRRGREGKRSRRGIEFLWIREEGREGEGVKYLPLGGGGGGGGGRRIGLLE